MHLNAEVATITRSCSARALCFCWTGAQCTWQQAVGAPCPGPVRDRLAAIACGLRAPRAASCELGSFSPLTAPRSWVHGSQTPSGRLSATRAGRRGATTGAAQLLRVAVCGRKQSRFRSHGSDAVRTGTCIFCIPCTTVHASLIASCNRTIRHPTFIARDIALERPTASLPASRPPSPSLFSLPPPSFLVIIRGSRDDICRTSSIPTSTTIHPAPPDC